jgi:hypothetical protein
MWSKTAPTVPGFYWYRYDNGTARIVERLAEADYDDFFWWMLGNEVPLSDDEMLKSNGEFWSEPLKAPE